MRIARIVNALPNDHSNETNNDSEPNIAVNPLNPKQMAITAFTPPDSGLTNGPVYYSTDGGENWTDITHNPGLPSGIDGKIGVTSSATLDLTYNTDFAQVEVDEQQINLTRFNLLFPEKRPFFLENASTFQFGAMNAPTRPP